MTDIIFKPSEEVIYVFLKRNDEDLKLGLVKEEMRKKEKHMRERDWKQRARYNYLKKGK